MKEREIVLAHKKGFMILAGSALVFFGCFTFPIWNLTKDFSQQIRVINIVTACASYFYIGGLLGLLFRHREIGKILIISTTLTILGFVCRFLVEYGEVSNTYNFTMPNILVHLLAALSVIFLAAASTGKKEENNGI